MSEATIIFNKVIQDAQNYESFNKNDDYMVSVIHFTLEVKDKQYENMQVEICQPYGTNYEREPIEVGEIIGTYKGTWNHNQFANLCEQYYRNLIGSTGRSIRGGRGGRMRNNSFISNLRVEMDIPEDGATSW